MSFKEALKRLESACNPHHETQKGTNQRFATVRRDDLQELLRHFWRVDQELRKEDNSGDLNC